MTEEKNRRKKAAAIQYAPGDDAPTVLAKGQGVIADKLIEKAEAAALPIYKDEKLAEALTKLDIGDYIPPELYTVVAEVLVFVTDLDKMRDEHMKNAGNVNTTHKH